MHDNIIQGETVFSSDCVLWHDPVSAEREFNKKVVRRFF